MPKPIRAALNPRVESEERERAKSALSGGRGMVEAAGSWSTAVVVGRASVCKRADNTLGPKHVRSTALKAHPREVRFLKFRARPCWASRSHSFDKYLGALPRQSLRPCAAPSAGTGGLYHRACTRCSQPRQIRAGASNEAKLWWAIVSYALCHGDRVTPDLLDPARPHPGSQGGWTLV